MKHTENRLQSAYDKVFTVCVFFLFSHSRNVYEFEFILNSVQQKLTYSAHSTSSRLTSVEDWRCTRLYIEKYSNATEETIK